MSALELFDDDFDELAVVMFLFTTVRLPTVDLRSMPNPDALSRLARSAYGVFQVIAWVFIEEIH
jgi:hypothetical protein